MSQNFFRPLTPKQRKAAEFLAKGCSNTYTAKCLCMRRETLSRWKKNPLFLAEIEKYRVEMHEMAMQRLPELFDATILALAQQLQSGDRQAYVALGMLKIFGAERILKETAIQRLLPPVNILTNP